LLSLSLSLRLAQGYCGKELDQLRSGLLDCKYYWAVCLLD